MSAAIWVLRDQDGAVVGASADSENDSWNAALQAADNAYAFHRITLSENRRMIRAVEREAESTEAGSPPDTLKLSHGFTLARTSLAPLDAPRWPEAVRQCVEADREAIHDALASAIGDSAYDCTRVWSAWHVGTMSEDDFVSIADSEDRLEELVDAVVHALRASPGAGAVSDEMVDVVLEHYHAYHDEWPRVRDTNLRYERNRMRHALEAARAALTGTGGAQP